MTLPLYVDHDTTRNALVRALRSSGIDVLTAIEAKMEQAEDEEQLVFAAAERRVLYSFNVGDYMRLHTECTAQGRSHAGIVLAKQQRYSVGEELRRLLRLLSTRSADEMRTTVEFLSNWGVGRDE